jgi:2-hydroxy-3-keto-5-methylthiopentenyl-1-phosphate phosphatase
MDSRRCWTASPRMDINLTNVRRSFGKVSIYLHIYVGPTYALEEIKLDSGFREFYAWCKANDIPVIIVSRCVYPPLADLRTD